MALITLLHDSWHGQDGNYRYVSILALLDVSVAFDTFNHGILLDRLRGLGLVQHGVLLAHLFSSGSIPIGVD